MRIHVDRQTVTQAALTAALLAALWAVFPASPQHANAPLQSSAEQALRPLTSEPGDEESRAASRARLQTLPVYRGAERLVGQLNAARAALLNAAAKADSGAIGGAAEDYQRTLDQVRSALAELQGYVDPDEFSRCLQDLLRSQTEAELGDQPIQESLLGILPRVSPFGLPTESPP